MRLRDLGLIALGGALLWLERKYPLRDQTPGGRRAARNLTLAVGAGLTVRQLEDPVVQPLSRWVERHRIGLVQRLPLPRALRQALAFMLLDYTLFLWHRRAHHAPWLWRFHQVHHLDRNLDSLTALRFHFGEMALSVPYRALQVLLIGAGPQELRAWQVVTLASVIFHHSNLRLPVALDEALARIVVTPRMHGTHHSNIRVERDSNFSSLISLWDDLHRTRQKPASDGAVVIGVDDRRDVTLPCAVALPFRRLGSDDHEA